ncbi:MAG: UbiA family prenyltransferase [Bdellovibrionia bacterium]
MIFVPVQASWVSIYLMPVITTFLSRKSSAALVVAALALSWIGLVSAASRSMNLMVWTSLITVYLVVVIYSYDDFFDGFDSPANWGDSKFWSGALSFFAILAAGIMLAVWFLPGPTAAWSSLLISAIGFFYTVPWKVNGHIYRLKRLFIGKNLMIAIGWGGLLFLAGESSHALTVYSIFVIAQVFMGAIIRDLDDVRDDEQHKVLSLPVVLGSRATIGLLTLLNLALLAFMVYLFTLGTLSVVAILGFSLVVQWRNLSLFAHVLLPAHPRVRAWTNLSTCLLIFVVRVAELWI